MKLLVTSFPADLLCEEVESGRTPLVICEWMKSSGLRGNELVLAFLREKTSQEKLAKKNNFIGKLFSNRRKLY